MTAARSATGVASQPPLSGAGELDGVHDVAGARDGQDRRLFAGHRGGRAQLALPAGGDDAGGEGARWDPRRTVAAGSSSGSAMTSAITRVTTRSAPERQMVRSGTRPTPRRSVSAQPDEWGHVA